MYAVCKRDDGAGQPTRREHVERKLDELRRAMEERGLKISRNNTEYLGTTSTKTQRSIYWERLKEIEDIHSRLWWIDGELDADVNHRVQSGWKNW